MLARAPRLARRKCPHTRDTLLHTMAGQRKDVAVMQLLLRAAPGTALAKGSDDRLPLHLAAWYGHTAAIRLLLAAAPQAATIGDWERDLPIHLAASRGHAAAVALLAAAAPQTVNAINGRGSTPLQRAYSFASLPDAACQLLRFGDGRKVLAAIAAGGQRAQHLFAHFVIARLPLTDAEWALVPGACPQLGIALPAAVAHSPAQASRLVARLPTSDRQQLRAAVLGHPSPQQQAGAAVDDGIALSHLTDAHWALVPTPCPGLGHALPAVLSHSPTQAAQLVRRLPPGDALLLHTAALALHRAQASGTIPPLPALAVWHILSHVLC